jgi:hypothetical protein
MTKKRFIQGALVSRREVAAHVPRVVEQVYTPVISDAYALAMTNKHKPWARRWLRERRYL